MSLGPRGGICTALTDELIERLNDNGIRTVTDFLVRDPEKLSQELHIPYKSVCSIRMVLLAETSVIPVSAQKLYEQALSSMAILSTGCESLDQLLDGGLYTGELTELAGDSCTGKTKICHWCVAATVKEDLQTVVYIDTCSSFCVSNVVADLSLIESDETVLQRRLQSVQVVEVLDIFSLFAVLDNIEEGMKDQGEDSKYRNVRLIIVDNLALVVSPAMGGHAPHNQSLIAQLGLKLKQLATNFSLAVLVTNNLVSVPNESFSDQRRPALGKVWSHQPHTRLVLDRRKAVGVTGSEVRATLVKSGRQNTPASVTFNLDKQKEAEPD